MHGIFPRTSVQPSLASDFLAGSIDPRISISRALNTATRINSSGFIETVNANLPRFDHDSATLAPRGLLIEEARTNRVIQSNTLGAAEWVRRNANVAQTATGPNNVVNSATTITATANNAFFRQRIVAVSGPVATSLYIKRRTGTGNILLSQSEPTGSEFAVNGNFSSATGWSTAVGWAIDTVAGTATYTAQSANRGMSNTTSTAVTNGKTYVLEYTVVSNTLNAGELRVGAFTGNSVVGPALITLSLAVGTHRFAFSSEAAGTRNIIDLWVTSAATSGALTIDNVSLFEVVETVVSVTSGWTRVSIPSVTLAQPNIGIKIATSGDAVDVYGVQNENGTTVTSVIPTTTTALTRNADVVTITGANFDNLWKTGKGSALVRARQSTVSGIQTLLQFDDATADNIIALRGNTTNPELYIKATTDQAQIDAGTIAANTSYSLAGAWDENNCAASANSGTPVLDSAATIPVVTQARFGSDGTNYLNGHLESVDYYNERVLNAGLQIISSSAGRRSIFKPVLKTSIFA